MCQGQVIWPALGTFKIFQLPAVKVWGSRDTEPYFHLCYTINKLASVPTVCTGASERETLADRLENA